MKWSVVSKSADRDQVGGGDHTTDGSYCGSVRHCSGNQDYWFGIHVISA